MLNDDQKAAFGRDGYLLVENAVDLDDLAAMHEASKVLAAAAEKPIRVWHERVLFRREPFRRLFDQERLIRAAGDLVGPDIQLLALDLLLTRPDAEQIGFHRDVGFACNKTLSMNTGIYFEDMTDELGPTGVIPGTQFREAGPGCPPPEEEMARAVSVNAPAGSVLFFDAALWHSGGKNTTGRDRLALFAYFGKYWIKRMDEAFTQPLPDELLSASDPLTRQLLGLGLMEGVTSYHGDGEGYNRDRGEEGIDF